MTEDRRNVLLLMSDQHNPRMTGYAGHPAAQTPNLDDLAASGIDYTSAYCTSPICVPSRASMATGRYVHELGTWDNASPYRGTPRSWGHHLAELGYRVTTIGKLHYGDTGDDTGFPDQRLAMHVHGGGDLRGVSLRPENRTPPPGHGLNNLLNAGAGESEYTRFDRAVADEAVRYLSHETSAEPWALMVSFVAPHFPLIAPPEFFSLYEPSIIPLPTEDAGAWDHPAVGVFKDAFGLSRDLGEDETRNALHAYLALCSFLDHTVGRVIQALHDSGASENTVVLYTSDHGESAGAHGLWFKHLMNEGSVGVPLLVSGPDIPGDRRVTAPVSHIDVYPTLLSVAGVGPPDDLSGVSLLDPTEVEASERPVIAEYHANGSTHASFMLRSGDWKYIEYIGERPQLFDLAEDPEETRDLAPSPEHEPTLATCRARLREVCDPEAVDRAAKADQARRVAEVGGPESAAAITVPYTPPPEL